MMGLICLLGQLVGTVMGSPFLVNCRGLNGHESIEIAHVETCDATPATLGKMTFGLQLDANSCVDQSLGQVVTLRSEEHVAWDFPPVAAVFNRIAHPHMPVLVLMVLPRVTSSPDSAKSLARNVILLI